MEGQASAMRLGTMSIAATLLLMPLLLGCVPLSVVRDIEDAPSRRPTNDPGIDHIDSLDLALDSEDEAVRGAAIRQLAAILVEEDINSDTWHRASEALQGVGPEARQALPSVIQALNHKEPIVRQTAATVLGNVGPQPGVVTALVNALACKDWQYGYVREAAAEALGKMGSAAGDAVPALSDALDDEFWFVREAAAEALGGMGPQARGSVPALTCALGDEGWSVREAALAAIERLLPNGEVVSALIEGLGNDSPSTRWGAALALKEMGSRAASAVPTLVRLLEEDDDNDVRRVAAEALGDIGEQEEAVPALTQALEDKYWRVRRAAVRALVKIGPHSDVVPGLAQAMSDTDPRVRSAAAQALGDVGTRATEAVPPLVQALEDDSGIVREAAVLALKGIDPRPEDVVPGLIEALDDEYGFVREAARSALTEITEQDFGGDVGRWQRWWSERQQRRP